MGQWERILSDAGKDGEKGGKGGRSRAIHAGVRAALAATAADMHIESAQGGSPAIEPNVSLAPTPGAFKVAW